VVYGSGIMKIKNLRNIGGYRVFPQEIKVFNYRIFKQKLKKSVITDNYIKLSQNSNLSVFADNLATKYVYHLQNAINYVYTYDRQKHIYKLTTKTYWGGTGGKENIKIYCNNKEKELSGRCIYITSCIMQIVYIISSQKFPMENRY